MRSSTTPIVLFVALLLLPAGVAQVPPLPGGPAPVYTIVLSGAPAEFAGLAGANATADAPVHFELTLGNVVCTEATNIPVTLTATPTGAPAYFSVAVEPAIVNVTIEQGPHGNPPVGEPGRGAGDFVVKGIVTGNITSNASVAVSVAATAPAPAGCQGAGGFSGATSEPLTIYANMTAPPPPPAEEPPEEDTPFVGLLAVAAVVASVALARRRKA